VLIRSHRQEALSRAYIQALAGVCGLSCSFRDFDYGIDLTLHSVQYKGRRYSETGFKLDVQAKSDRRATLTAESVLHDLEVKAYEDLRDPAAGCPRILVLLVLPPEEADWTEQTEQHLLLRGCAYWLSLKGMRRTSNRRTVRVALPRANVFSAPALLALMDKIKRGEER
jgi:hypothetical protein